MNKETLERLRSGYVGWKPWSPRTEQTHQHSIYDEEIMRAKLASGAMILEVGFGEGTFLDWARLHGFQCVGLELDAELVSAARTRGHVVHQGEVREVFPSVASEFDAIVLFDVLEHLTIEGILALLGDLCRLLRPDGKIIARFPNGSSPFGRAYQYGDATHLSVLSCSSMSQIGLAAGFKIEGAYNAARGSASRAGGIRNFWLLRRLAFALRDVIQALIARIYYGRDMPMDPNVTVILRKSAEQG